MTIATHPHVGSSLTVVVPLYQYPIKPFTWQPLFDAISSCFSTQFIVIINPNSGPGVDPDGWQPDRRYKKGIVRLKAFSNVTLVGYVRLDYCRRSVEDVQKDIDKYASWRQVDKDDVNRCEDVSMEGIFFDEVPNIFAIDIADQLASYSKAVKNMKGFGTNRWIIHNPGTIPDVEFLAYWTKISSLSEHSPGHNDYNSPETSCDESGSGQGVFVRAMEQVPDPKQSREGGGPDVVIIFEGPYSDWQQDAIQERMSELSSYDRSQCCHVVHSVPDTDLEQLFGETQSRGTYLYLTSLTEKFYESFDNSWRKFALLVEKVNLGARA